MKFPRALPAAALAALFPALGSAAVVGRLPTAALPPISAPAFAAPAAAPAQRLTAVPFSALAPSLSISAAAVAAAPAPAAAANGAPQAAAQAAAPRAPSPVAALMERLSRALIGERREQTDVGDLVLIGKAGAFAVTLDGNEWRAPLPALGRYAGGDGGTPAVALTLGREGRAMVVEMPISASDLTKLHPQDVHGAVRALRLEIAATTSFAPGETVRVRDEATGEIRRATFVGRRADASEKFELRDPDGAARLSPTRLVYKDAVGPLEPRTPATPKDETILWPEMRARRGDALEDFLDGAAWLSSHPEFRAASHPERWRMLAGYLRAVMRPAEEAAMAEMLDLGFPELLTHGIGVCRHLSSLLAAALRESGYEARVMTRVPGQGTGHAWVEVESPSGKEEDRWIIDPMNDRAMSWPEAQAMARESEKSLAAIYYVSPDRSERAPAAATK